MQIASINEQRRKVMMIDSKSFYASCECAARGLNPLTTMLVVMSRQENTNGGLVLAASPRAKKELGISNVTRSRDVPDDPRLLIVEPRMNYYIAMNKQVNDLFREFVAEEDLHLYSIDESLLDLTPSWTYLRFKYGQSLTMTDLARIIQLAAKKRFGLYLTVGIGDNPTMAKLALDIEAKHNRTLIGEWHYENVPHKLWPLNELSQVWSIGKKTAKKLNRLGILSMEDLALYNPYKLVEKFGVRGGELIALAWGVDRSVVAKRYHTKAASISNSQVLPRDYNRPAEIKNVIREIGEQIAARLRGQHKEAGLLSLYLGTSMHEQAAGFHANIKLDVTNQSDKIVAALYELFDVHYEGQTIRHIGVGAGKLQPDGHTQLDLFTDPEIDVKKQMLDQVVDQIRHKFGTTALVKSSSLALGGTMIQRAGLVGGHSGGNAYGVER
ncbi:Y-family DNA polymerase [Weissella halotolerans]|uniref:Nucleotidyltransferase DNA polymerase for DNA repair n=1 Tax=Weissella halotolerans DSM 20190 TaxID=1123500 RepID=A0A0R2FZ86_9LACO|nr:Y-family DNA polymerase [Weissella halotolerans]KRN33520.1 nucleotidyltransferase DNA polymerase for DNA repair [Weissella halotolerans DSM 20190]